MKALILDLDGTILDTSKIQEARDARRWRECMARAGDVQPYEDIREIMAVLLARKKPIAIVTSSVSNYAKALLNYHSIPYDHLIAYHDARPPKPAPTPVNKALKDLGVRASDAIGVGDRSEDAVAYKAAVVAGYAALWNPDCEKHPDWKAGLNSPSDLLALLAD